MEGIQALYDSTCVRAGTPKLYCDNRAAVHLTAGSSEWRTKALLNRIHGVQSLIQLGLVIVEFKPTLGMEADVLAMHMPTKTLRRQRSLVGCVPCVCISSVEGVPQVRRPRGR